MITKSCWDIMECEGSENCIAKSNPSKKCWEHSQEIGAVQYYFSICPDCLVYQAHRHSPSLSIHEIAEGRRNLAFFPKKRQRCPLSSYVDFKNAKIERREKTRFLCNGHLHAALRSSDMVDRSCHLIDLSQTGLAFTRGENGALTEKKVQIDLYLDNFSVKGLPVKIISGSPSSYSQEQTRYGACFGNLSTVQESGLVDLLHVCVAA